MYNFTVCFADLNINITSIYKYTYDFCKDFLTDGEADFSVSTTPEKIRHEIDISEYEVGEPYAESICIYREIAEMLPKFDRFVFHGACISYKGKGYIFTAPSGTGKSTHISLWRKYLGKGVEVVNGDKPILHFHDNGVTIYSTPYAGKERWQNHSSVDMQALCIINRGEKNEIERITFGDKLTEVFKQIYKPYDTESAIKTLDLFSRLSKMPLYLLKCDISEEAVRTSFNAMSGDSYDECKI